MVNRWTPTIPSVVTCAACPFTRFTRGTNRVNEVYPVSTDIRIETLTSSLASSVTERISEPVNVLLSCRS